jgi:hypothetical protein
MRDYFLFSDINAAPEHYYKRRQQRNSLDALDTKKAGAHRERHDAQDQAGTRGHTQKRHSFEPKPTQHGQ